MKVFAIILAIFFIILLGSQVAFTQLSVFLLGLILGLVFIKFRVGFATACRHLILYRYTKSMELFFWIIALSTLIMIPLINYSPQIYSSNTGAISLSLLVGAFMFGLAQQINDGCVSGTLYKSSINDGQIISLIFLFIGVWLGTLHYEFWTTNFFYGYWNVNSLFEQPMIVLAVNLFFIVFFCMILRWIQYKFLNLKIYEDKKVKEFKTKTFFNLSSYQFVIGSIFVLNIVYFFITGNPWSIIRGFSDLSGHFSLAILGDDTYFMEYWSGGREVVIENPIFSSNVFLSNLGFVLGSFLFAIYHKQLNLNILFSTNIKLIFSKIISGFLLGYGAFIAFGCNIGAFMNGISSGSLHSWLWLLMVLVGSWIGIKLNRILRI